MEIEYFDEALAEGQEAASWYAKQEPGLEVRFLKKWREAEARMVAGPELNRVFGNELRRGRFEVFPYALIYRIRPENLVEVIAIMHSSRKPGYWRKRLERGG